MTSKKYTAFASRLIDALQANGHGASRSPNGICITTLAKISGASPQICRRYIRGDALPDYEKTLKIAAGLNISAGWLIYGEPAAPQPIAKFKTLDDDLLHYILHKCHALYREETNHTHAFANFVVELVRDVREIDTSKANLEKIIDLAISSISSYYAQRNQNTP